MPLLNINLIAGRSGKTRKGSKHLNAALTDAAMAALRTNDSYLQALYRRKTPQLGHARALGAVKHSMLCAIWHMLSTGELYNDLGGEYFARRDPERQTRRLVAQLQRLGHTVILQQAPPGSLNTASPQRPLSARRWQPWTSFSH